MCKGARREGASNQRAITRVANEVVGNGRFAQTGMLVPASPPVDRLLLLGLPLINSV